MGSMEFIILLLVVLLIGPYVRRKVPILQSKPVQITAVVIIVVILAVSIVAIYGDFNF